MNTCLLQHCDIGGEKLPECDSLPKWIKLCGDVPRSPGVYCVWKESVPIYIGTSSNMGHRLRTHTKRHEFIYRRCDLVTWVETGPEPSILCTERFNRYAIEGWMIMKHKPIVNSRWLNLRWTMETT